MPDKPNDPIPLPPYMVRPDAQLVMLVGCGACKSSACLVGVVVPGFVYHCESCGLDVDKGCVIACPHCGTSCCADCVYKAHLKTRIAQLAGH